MARVIATDFDPEELPKRQFSNTKYSEYRDLLLEHGQLKVEVENPDNRSLKGRRDFEGGKIYQAILQWFHRHPGHGRACGRLKGNTLWLWLEKEE